MAGYIGPAPVPQATQNREAFTATSGQTSFATAGYTPQFIDVYLNGVKLAAADYTATNGSDVVLASGATANDILEVVAFSAFTVADQAFTGTTTAANLTVTGAFTSQGIDDNADAVAITIDSSERVGIGTSSPNALVHASGAAASGGSVEIRLEDTAASSNSRLMRTGSAYSYAGVGANETWLYHAGAGTINIGPDGAGTVKIVNGGSERMRIDSSGNVGIGTSPSTVLHINDASDPILRLQRGGAAYSQFQSDSAGSLYISADAGNSGASSRMQFNVDGSEAMRLDSSNNLLVGTTTTAGVIGGSTVAGSYLSPDGGLFASRSGDAVAHLNRQTSDGEIIEFRKDGTTVGTIVTSSGLVGLNNGNTALTVDDSTNSIHTRLTNGTLRDGSTSLGKSDSRFKDLYLSGTAYVDTAIEVHAGNSLKMQNVAGNGFATIQNSGAGTNTDLAFSTAGSERMRIDSNGDLLVGKTSADYTTAGVMAEGDGTISSVKAGTTGVFNRLTSDGDILQFRKNGTTVGSIGTTSSDLYIGTGDTTLRFADGVDGVIPTGTGGAQRDGAVNLGAASNRFKQLYLSVGVVFGDAGGSGTSSSNTFDSYEEGTWTPLITGSASNPSSTANASNLGFYTKIGRQVTVCFRVDYSSVSGGSGNFEISGLPFTSTSSSYFRSSGNISFFRGVTHGGNRLAPHALANATKFIFYKLANASEFDDVILTSALSSSITIHGFYTYFTD